jgi:hypothetical protein
MAGAQSVITQDQVIQWTPKKPAGNPPFPNVYMYFDPTSGSLVCINSVGTNVCSGSGTGTITGVTAGTGLGGGGSSGTVTLNLLTALPNGETATTQTVGDNTTKVATDAFVIANAGSGGGANVTLSNLTSPTAITVTLNGTTFNATALTSAYQIGGLNFITRPDSDTTSLAIGTSAGAAISATNSNDVFVGDQAGEYGTGGYSVAIGGLAMQGVSGTPLTGGNNTAVGYLAAGVLQGAAHDDTAIGNDALEAATTPFADTAVGMLSLGSVTNGGGNTAVGYETGYAGTALTTGTYNSFFGYSARALTAADTNEIVISSGSTGITGLGSNSINLGNIFEATGTGTPSTSVSSLAGSLNFSTATNAGAGYVNMGFPEASATTLMDFVNQSTGDTFSGMKLRMTQSGSYFNGIWDNVMTLGWNNAGGAPINSAWPYAGWQMENAYCASSATNCVTELQYSVGAPASSTFPAFNGRAFTMQNKGTLPSSDATDLPGSTNFMVLRPDSGLGLQYLTGDGHFYSGVTAAWTSAAGGTFTYTIASGTWPWDFGAGTLATVSGCSVSAYNSTATAGTLIAVSGVGVATFTVTGVGSNPGSSATGCSVQGGAAAQYITLSPATITINGTGNVQAGGNLIANAGTNGTAAAPLGLQLNGGNNLLQVAVTSQPAECPGISTYNIIYWAGTVPFGCSYTASSSTPPTNIIASSITASYGLANYTGGGLGADNIFQSIGSGGLFIEGSGSSSQANFAGKYMGNNGAGAYWYDICYNHGSPGTALTNCEIGGWTGIASHFVDGSVDVYTGNGSGTGALNNGITATTQAASDSSTKLATTAFVKTQNYAAAIATPGGTPTYTAGTNVTSVVCSTSYTCTNTRGELTIVGGTATTGTIATVNFSATLSAAPGLCLVTQEGGASVFGIGHGVPSTTSFTITSSVSVAASTVTIDYQCLP